MNILLYVLIILSAISIMTYTRLQTFLSVSTSRQEYACFMQERDRLIFNEIEDEIYKKHHGKGSEKDDPQSPTDATRKLNFFVFTSEEIRNSHQSAYETIRTLSLRLIHKLYDPYPFFQEVQEERGDAAEALINRIIIVTQNLENKKGINSFKDLPTINLQDEDLQPMFAKMLEGGDDSPAMEKCGSRPLKGYPSLKTFIEVKKLKGKVQPIRIQLTSQEVLDAIFVNPSLVNEIMHKREELRLQAGGKGSVEQETASNTFRSLYKSKIPGYFDAEMFDFTITKTKP